MEIEFIQQIVSKAARIATASAMAGTPLTNIIWEPASNATDNCTGKFIVVYENMNLPTTEKHSWE